jgi:hypothetical protein
VEGGQFCPVCLHSLVALFTWSNLSQEPGKSRKETKEKYDESALDFTSVNIVFSVPYQREWSQQQPQTRDYAQTELAANIKFCDDSIFGLAC